MSSYPHTYVVAHTVPVQPAPHPTRPIGSPFVSLLPPHESQLCAYSGHFLK